jgi:hypothetical protein
MKGVGPIPGEVNFENDRNKDKNELVGKNLTVMDRVFQELDGSVFLTTVL